MQKTADAQSSTVSSNSEVEQPAAADTNSRVEQHAAAHTSSRVEYHEDSSTASRVEYQVEEEAVSQKSGPIQPQATSSSTQHIEHKADSSIQDEEALQAQIANWPGAAKTYVSSGVNLEVRQCRVFFLSLLSAGLLPKWSWAQTPDLRALRSGWVLLESTCPQGNVKQLATNFIILFGIRGHIGVTWAASEMLKMQHDTLSISEVLSQLHKSCIEAKHMVARFGEAWASHSDGLARRSTGRWWLEAAMQDNQGVIKSIAYAQNCIQEMTCNASHDSERIDDAIKTLAENLIGVMPTAPGQHAMKYTAQAMARSLWLICATTYSRWRPDISAFHVPDNDAFQTLWDYQANKPTHALFSCPDTLVLCIQAMEVMGLLASSMAILISPSPVCTWVDAFVTACEYKQLIEHSTVEELQELLAVAKANPHKWVALIQQGLDNLDIQAPGICHARAIKNLMTGGVQDLPHEPHPTYVAPIIAAFSKKKTKAKAKAKAIQPSQADQSAGSGSTTLEQRTAGCILAKMAQMHKSFRKISETLLGRKRKYISTKQGAQLSNLNRATSSDDEGKTDLNWLFGSEDEADKEGSKPKRRLLRKTKPNQIATDRTAQTSPLNPGSLTMDSNADELATLTNKHCTFMCSFNHPSI